MSLTLSLPSKDNPQMYRRKLMKVCDHAGLVHVQIVVCLPYLIFSYNFACGYIYTPIPTTLFISTDNLLVLLEDAHESQSSTKPVVQTQERSPKSDVPQNENSGSLRQPKFTGQGVLGSLTLDKEQYSPVQTVADEGLYIYAFSKS